LPGSRPRPGDASRKSPPGEVYLEPASRIAYLGPSAGFLARKDCKHVSRAPDDEEEVVEETGVGAGGDEAADAEGDGDEGDDLASVAGGLTGKQRRYLRALGHHLEPLVQLGKSGITDGVIGAIDAALGQHELVKVRIGTECPVGAKEAAREIAPKVRAALAQTLGRTFLVYRRHPKEPTIVLPR
jgi:RNA-binding protein